jgi:hypothetical protein
MKIYQVWMIRNEYGSAPRPCGPAMNIFDALRLEEHLTLTNFGMRAFEIRTLA